MLGCLPAINEYATLLKNEIFDDMSVANFMEISEQHLMNNFFGKCSKYKKVT